MVLEMDIKDFWPITPTPMKNSPEEWERMIFMRQTTFIGFAEIEKEKGFIEPKISLSTSKGQEILRLLAFRTLEELSEAYESVDPDHYYEELIDAFNYLLSMFIITGKHDPNLPHNLERLSSVSLPNESNQRLTLSQIGRCTLIFGDKLGNLLRNRAWMNNAQNTYFDGDLWQIVSVIFSMILSQFKDFHHFWCYYIAKDSVLQFRLRSKY